MGNLSIVTLTLGLLVASLAPEAHGKEPPATAASEAKALLSADVRTSFEAGRALANRPGAKNRDVRLALAAVVKEAGLPVEMPKTLRKAERAGLVDRIRQAALLARLASVRIAVPEGMVAIPGGVARHPLTGREVVVADFFLDRLEVAREGFARFLKESKHEARGEGFLTGWRDGKYPGGTGKLPVTHVSRRDAAAFATWRKARLPRVMEWEIARRGCGGKPYPWGAQPKTGLANVMDGKGSGNTEGVEGRPDGATPLGVLRMAGNVSEWTSSPWAKAEDVGLVAGESFLSVPQFTRQVYRKTKATVRRRDLGFRCAASIPRR